MWIYWAYKNTLYTGALRPLFIFLLNRATRFLRIFSHLEAYSKKAIYLLERKITSIFYKAIYIFSKKMIRKSIKYPLFFPTNSSKAYILVLSSGPRLYYGSLDPKFHFQKNIKVVFRLTIIISLVLQHL